MKSPLVSIIVPVYNVEKYVDHCIETIVNQTYSNIQVILVDDGSMDRSGEKCDEWAKKDDRIEVIHKRNDGLGHARNSGLEIAKGHFVMFVDSDDYISKNMTERLVNEALRTESDTVYCSLNRCFDNNRIIPIEQQHTNASFQDTKIIENVLLEMIGTSPERLEDRYLYMSVWHALYSMEIIKDYRIAFPSERELISEDIIYHIDYLRRSQKVTFIPDCLYYYRENKQSLSLKYNPDRIKLVTILYEAMNAKLGQFLPKNQYILRTQRMLLGAVRSCIQSIVAADIHDKLKLIKDVCNDRCIEEVLSTYPYRKNPLKYRVFNAALKHKYVLLTYFLSRIAIAG